MNIDTYHYRVNQLHREDVLRAARHQQLLHLATARRPKTAQAYRAALLALWASLFREPNLSV